nr:putative copia-type protein [Tanacetum cinerariifolium]
SAEAEFRGIAKGLAEALWIRKLVSKIRFSPRGSTQIMCDNKAAIQISENHVQHDRTKHVEVDRHFIKEKLEEGIIKLPFVKSSDQLAEMYVLSYGLRVWFRGLGGCGSTGVVQGDGDQSVSIYLTLSYALLKRSWKSFQTPVKQWYQSLRNQTSYSYIIQDLKPAFFLKGRDYDAKRERLETVNNKTPNWWLTKEKADLIEEDVDLKRKRPASQRRTLQRRKRGERERTIRGTTIKRETFREDHKIGGSRQRFEMPFNVTGLSNHGQSLGSDIFCKLADEDVTMAIKKKKSWKSFQTPVKQWKCLVKGEPEIETHKVKAEHLYVKRCWKMGTSWEDVVLIEESKSESEVIVVTVNCPANKGFGSQSHGTGIAPVRIAVLYFSKSGTTG